ncbi:transposase [Streptomyces sp. NPDC012616]|uniref:transposase n=1 Tax=Streptomyces sp. NPDC012616 TaxID=3364840 RepID=UPI0036EB15F9
MCRPSASLISRAPVIRFCAPARLKGVSSRRLRHEYDSQVRRYLWGGHFWSGSDFAGSCGGAPLTVVKQYVENQHWWTGSNLSHIARATVSFTQSSRPVGGCICICICERQHPS